jgi:nucleoside-diphosphate kinase
MTGNRTLAIIKPDAFGAGKAGKIVAHLEAQGFRIVCARVLHMSKAEAGAFYEVHKGRPFYGELVEFMSSGPCMPLVLEKADAVAAYRMAIGTTDPAEAAAGSVRKLFAESKGRNAVHGSDSDDNARQEGMFFFGAAALI